MLNLFFEGIARSLKTQKLTMLLMRFCWMDENGFAEAKSANNRMLLYCV
jgi:hypothetical protein